MEMNKDDLFSHISPGTFSFNDTTNMVDERYELLALIFRLAGREEYSHLYTDYQKEINETFRQYINHPAVIYAKNLSFGYSWVFKFSVHIIKQNEIFQFYSNIDSLYPGEMERVYGDFWTYENTLEFLQKINDFYTETKFNNFYISHEEFYKNETKKFVQAVWSKINFEWFLKYIESLNQLNCIISPSNSYNNYAVTLNNKYIYALQQGIDFSLIHEYCHSFSNPIAEELYKNDDLFRQMCDDPINKSGYAPGLEMAYEYITRVYTILYFVENSLGKNEVIINNATVSDISDLFENEKKLGFPCIEEIYNMEIKK